MFTSVHFIAGLLVLILAVLSIIVDILIDVKNKLRQIIAIQLLTRVQTTLAYVIFREIGINLEEISLNIKYIRDILDFIDIFEQQTNFPAIEGTEF